MWANFQVSLQLILIHPLWSVALLGFLSGTIVNIFVAILPKNASQDDVVLSLIGLKQFFLNIPFKKQGFISIIQKLLSWRFWVVIICVNCFTFLFYYEYGFTNRFFTGILWLIYLFTVLIIDIQYRRIIWKMNLVGIGFGFLIGIMYHGLWLTILGGVTSFTIFILLYITGKIMMNKLKSIRQMTDSDAIGLGDVIFSVVIGFWLGWPIIISGLVITFGLIGLFGVTSILIKVIIGKYKPLSSIPYCPFIIVATTFSFILHDEYFPILNLL